MRKTPSENATYDDLVWVFIKKCNGKSKFEDFTVDAEVALRDMLTHRMGECVAVGPTIHAELNFILADRHYIAGAQGASRAEVISKLIDMLKVGQADDPAFRHKPFNFYLLDKMKDGALFVRVSNSPINSSDTVHLYDMYVGEVIKAARNVRKELGKRRCNGDGCQCRAIFNKLYELTNAFFV